MPRFHIAYMMNLEGYKPDKIGKLWDKLCRWAGTRDLITSDSKFIGIALDDPGITDPDKCRYYCCITVPDDFGDDELVNIMDLKAGRYGVYCMEGYGDDIGKSYKMLYGDWLPHSGYQPADRPSYEIYQVTPDQHPEGKFVVDFCIPVIPL